MLKGSVHPNPNEAHRAERSVSRGLLSPQKRDPVETPEGILWVLYFTFYNVAPQTELHLHRNQVGTDIRTQYLRGFKPTQLNKKTRLFFCDLGERSF